MEIKLDKLFEKKSKKIKDILMQEKLRKQIIRIVGNPLIGKPMRYSRVGTREVHIAPFRLVYSYSDKDGLITFLDLYHKDEQ